MRFLCLACEEQASLDALSQSEWQVLRQETLDYVATLRRSGRLVDTQPLQSATRARTVRVRGGKVSVTDGPFAETKEQIGGYFLVEAENLDEAIEIASHWPSARFGSIEVRPIDEPLRMDRRYARADGAREGSSGIPV